MKCRIIAAGTRLPAWIGAGFHEYEKRLTRPIRLELKEIALSTRHADVERARNREGEAMLQALRRDDHVVALEVGGRWMSTEQLAQWLQQRLALGTDIAFLIGGPDGLAAACRARAALQWSLSPLTFPHGLVRIMLAEQLYRAASLIAGHPYHRA
ncbi:MAG: 23S rRNA (pseudouridine(1915)-N(3))-methyltransferase RlmH [Proteobacteria bacterium]|nr:23S rRNA (pseudouridine(1915)-N(3))-methyltransferase RlmH [Pseudomonadota bacterium]